MEALQPLTAHVPERPPALTLGVGDERHVEQTRDGRAAPLDRRERIAGAVLGVAFVLVASAGAASAHGGWRELLLAVTLAAGYGLLYRIEFEILTGSAVPTQLLLVPMLVLLPLGWVPAAVGAGLVAGGVVDWWAGRIHAERVVLALVSSWHSVGPVLVLAVLDPTPSWADAWMYGVALGGQFALDAASVLLWERLTGGAPARVILPYLPRPWLVDVALAPVGLAFALAARPTPYVVLLSLPLAALLAVFARERKARIDGVLELSHAYRGTALLLGDVVEADDAYTGLHSRDVVSLSVAVADELGVDEATRRETELTALLHDVGKIRIPGEIINKPGPLTEEERAVMETHTVVGEEMLDRVGGLLGRVGRIVRSCHERWDGRGYPDGLAGDTIPLVARIVMCCDAFSAMTTDRSYRRALSLADALAEVARCAGTQFDPRVVSALVTVVGRGALERPAA